MRTVEHTWHQMGSDAHLVVVAPEAATANRLLHETCERLEQLESRWSRFRSDSEVCALNAAGTQGALVGADTALLVGRMHEARELTDGRFDPTVLDAVLTSGYDLSLDRIRAAGVARGSAARADHLAAPGLDSLAVQPLGADRWWVSLGAGVRIDPGGIGKGLAADIVADETLRAGALGVAVNLGGDVVVRGTSPDGGPWVVAVDDPVHGEVATAQLHAGALVTSTPVLRRWRSADGREQHHVRDPRGGLADVELTAVTVIAGAGWWAEAAATSALVAASRWPAGSQAWAREVAAHDDDVAMVIGLPDSRRPVRSIAAASVVTSSPEEVAA